jgi:hypothetical protein
MLQVNLLIFVLCLLGIRAFIEDREIAAGGWFVTATALVFYVFLSRDPRPMSRAGRLALGLGWAGIAVIALGRDIVGDRLHHYTGGYSIIVWVMLLLFGLSVAWSLNRPSVQRSPYSTNGRASP